MRPTQILFFILGACYGSVNYFHAAKIYIESYNTVPKGSCKNTVRTMMWTFFVAWLMFPILFVMGPEGFGHLTAYGSTICHTVADILSKNLWGLQGHYLRYKARRRGRCAAVLRSPLARARAPPLLPPLLRRRRCEALTPRPRAHPARPPRDAGARRSTSTSCCTATSARRPRSTWRARRSRWRR